MYFRTSFTFEGVSKVKYFRTFEGLASKAKYNVVATTTMVRKYGSTFVLPYFRTEVRKYFRTFVTPEIVVVEYCMTTIIVYVTCVQLCMHLLGYTYTYNSRTKVQRSYTYCTCTVQISCFYCTVLVHGVGNATSVFAEKRFRGKREKLFHQKRLSRGGISRESRGNERTCA